MQYFNLKKQHTWLVVHKETYGKESGSNLMKHLFNRLNIWRGNFRMHLFTGIFYDKLFT